MKIKLGDPVGTSNDFWYDLTGGGYIIPEEVLEDQKDIDAVNAAIQLLENFEQALIDAEMKNEF